jgi:hypothetical protein
VAAKRLFVSLVTPGEGREDTRTRIDMPDDAAMRSVIQTFAGTDARLIVTDKAGERGSVELSHEALIRHWRELRQWIDANRDNLRTRARLKEDRREWLKSNKDPELLSIPSLRLREVQKLSEEPGDVRTDDIKDYIDALLDHDRQRKEAEEAKQRQELEAARRRGLVAAAAAVLLLLIAVFAGREAWVANEQKRFADAQTAEAQRQKVLADKQKTAALDQKILAEKERGEADEQKAAALQNESATLAGLSSVSRPVNPALAAKLALAALPRSGADHRKKLDVALEALSAALQDLRERKVLRGHDDSVNWAAFSPDGAHVVTASTARQRGFGTRRRARKPLYLLAIKSGYDLPPFRRTAHE